MNSTKTLALAVSAAALLGAAVPAQAVQSFSLNFDGPGSNANAFAPVGLTIGYGQFVPRLDSDGDPISGSEHWEIDPGEGPVPVIDPSTVGFGAAPSPTKALDARDGPVLLVFNTPFNLKFFTTTLDNSTIGDLANTEVKLYDANDALLASLTSNQSTPGYVVSGSNLGQVKTILLPSTAFYDNLTAIPEPATMLWGAVAVAMGGLRRVRARRA